MNETTQRCGQIYITFSVGDAASSRVDGGYPYGASSHDMISYLGLIRLWLACVTESFSKGYGYLRAFEERTLQDAVDIAADILSGKTRAPALIPQSARAAEAPKIMLNRRTKRIYARGLPASRQYGWFRYTSPRTLSGNQFFELLAKLSVNGRVGVYRLEYKTRLCVRRPMNIAIRQSPSLTNFVSINLGYCEAHLWPN